MGLTRAIEDVLTHPAFETLQRRAANDWRVTFAGGRAIRGRSAAEVWYLAALYVRRGGEPDEVTG